MAVIFAVLLITAFYVFLALGIIAHLTRKGAKRTYFALSALGLIGTIMMFTIFNWDLEKDKNTAVQKISEVKENNILQKNEAKNITSPLFKPKNESK